MRSAFLLKNFLLLLFFYLFFLTGALAQNKKIDSLQREIKQLERIHRDITRDTTLVKSYYRIAEEYNLVDDQQKEQANTRKALDLVSSMLERPSSSGKLKKYLLHKQALGYGNLGANYEEISDYPKALFYHFKALKIDESINHRRGIFRHLSNIGITYGVLGESKKALEYYLKSLAIARELNSIELEGTVYENIGSEYNQPGNRELALQYYTKALEIFKDLQDSGKIAVTLGNIGTVYNDLGDDKFENGLDPKDIKDYRTAANYYKEAVVIYEGIEDKRGKSIVLGNLATAYIKLKKYNDAKQVLLQSLALAEEIHDLTGLMISHQNLSELYADLNDIKKSFEHYKKYIVAKDSIFNKENIKKNLEAEINYEFEKKEAAQKAENEKQVIALEAENQIQRNARNFIIILSLMLLLLITVGLIYFNNKKNLKVREQHSQQLILSQEKERQRISKELHDSIGQNILFIKNQMIKKNDLSLMPSVDETLEEVRNISKDLYPNQLEKYGLIAAVDALAEKVKESSRVFVSHDLEAINKNIPVDQLINYYRIMQECISNTIKHADATALRISAERNNDNIELTIQDNGKGFDESTIAKKAQRSFGILNIEERVKYLKGKFKLETSPGKGTKYTFLIPA